MKTEKSILMKMSDHNGETSQEMWPLSQNANNRHLDSQTVDNVFLPEGTQELCSSFTILSDARSTDQNQRQHFCAFDEASDVKNQPQVSVSARDAVDPDKYVTITDDEGVVKFKCARCGNAYKWRKSLNKHWKEKHSNIDGTNAVRLCYALESAAPSAIMDMFEEDRRQPSAECIDHHDTSRDNCNYFHSCVTSLPMQISRSSNAMSSTTASQSSPTYVPSCYRKMKDRDGLQFSDYHVQKEKRFGATVNLKHQIFSSGNPDLIPSTDPSISLSVAPDNPNMQNYAGSLELTSYSRPSSDLAEGLGEWNNEGVLDLSCKGHSIRSKASNLSLTSEEKSLPMDLSLKSSSSTAIVVQNCFAEDDPWRSASGLNPMTSTGGAFSPKELRCFRCCVKFSSMAGLNQHFAIQHLDSLIALTSLPFEKRGNVFVSVMSRVLKNCCIICGVSFPSTQKLAEHYDKEHAIVQPNPYQNSITAEHQKSTFSRSVQNPIPDNFGFQLSGNRLKLLDSDYKWTSADVQINEQRTYKEAMFPAIECRKDVASNFISQNKRKSHAGSFLNNGFNESHRLSSAFDAENCESLMGFSKFCDSVKQSSVDGADCERMDTTVIQFASELERSVKGTSKRRGLPNVKMNLPYKCDVCGFCARWPSEMNQHKKNHSSEKPFKCPNCSYRSKWKWDVGKHLKSCGSSKGRPTGGKTVVRKRFDDTLEQGSSFEGHCSSKKLWRTNSSAAELGKLSGWKNSCATLKKAEENNNYARDQCLKVDNDMTIPDENTDKSVSLESVKNIDLMKHEEGDLSNLSGQNGHNCVAFGLIMDGCTKIFDDNCFHYAHSLNSQTGILKDNMSRCRGHCFGGITFPGGRLRCCFCDYEAISFTSFHKQQCVENNHSSRSLALSNFKGSQNLGTNYVCSHVNIVCDKERVKNRYFESEFWKCLGLKRKLQV